MSYEQPGAANMAHGANEHVPCRSLSHRLSQTCARAIVKEQ